MHFKSILAIVTLLLSTSSFAIESLPVSSILSAFHIPATAVPSPTAASLASALVSAQSSLANQVEVKSAAQYLATHLPSTVLDDLTKEGLPHITSTAPPTWYTGLPAKVKDNLMSQQSVMDRVVSSVLHLKETATGGTSNPAAPRATPKKEVVGAGAALVGVMGVMAML